VGQAAAGALVIGISPGPSSSWVTFPDENIDAAKTTAQGIKLNIHTKRESDRKYNHKLVPDYSLVSKRFCDACDPIHRRHRISCDM
jgi:hypothetical protein